MRQRGGSGIQPEEQLPTKARTNSWWDNPGRPTPYLLWGLIWCRCGTTMVPLDRHNGSTSTERFYRCDAGCGRPPVLASRLEREVLRAVVDAARTRLPRYTLRRIRDLRVAWPHCGPDQRRDLIRRWIYRVVADAGQPPQLQWLAGLPSPA
jgi:hypothetical protein